MVSIIIINYHVKEELFKCIESIFESRPKTLYEIIVVDNDEKKTIQQDLAEKFPKVMYITNENKGFGQGNNIGAKYAKGEFLFFLNPDTKFINNALDLLVEYLSKHKDAAIASPLLYDHGNKPYNIQGYQRLTPIRAIFALSILCKILPDNKIYREYYLSDWDKKEVKEVFAAPGSAFMIRKKVFDKIGKFDEKYFLYFEEFDIGERVANLGFKAVLDPSAKVLHYRAQSTKARADIERKFRKSRFYFFRKHFGLIWAILTEVILRINKYILGLIIVLILLSIFYCL